MLRPMEAVAKYVKTYHSGLQGSRHMFYIVADHHCAIIAHERCSMAAQGCGVMLTGSSVSSTLNISKYSTIFRS